MTESVFFITRPFQHYKDHVLSYLFPENLPSYALQAPTARPAKDPVSQMRELFKIVNFPNAWTHGWDNPILKTWDEIYDPQALMDHYDAAIAIAINHSIPVVIECAEPYDKALPPELKFLHDAREHAAIIIPSADGRKRALDDILTAESTIYVVGDTLHDAANSYRRLHDKHKVRHGRLPPLFCDNALDADGMKSCDNTREFLTAFNKTHNTALACAKCMHI